MQEYAVDFSFQKTLHTVDGPMQLDVAARIPQGSFVSLYGPSGAGKTSILRMLAGLILPDTGYVRVQGHTWFEAAQQNGAKPSILPVQKRSIGYVFQDAALFPNMSVRKNIAFAQGKDRDVSLLEELLELTGLCSLAQRHVETLSGGQRQRVALARALAGKPQLLLLDEPVSALDRAARAELQQLLADLHQRFALTTILVSHHPDEIIRLADWVYPLQEGRFGLVQKPADFFMDMPADAHIVGRILDVNGSGIAKICIENRIFEVDLPEGDWKRNDAVKMRITGHKFLK